MTKLIEITATFLRERFRFENANGDAVIGDVAGVDEDGNESEFAVKGTVEDDEPSAHQRYHFYGHWTTYSNRHTGRDERQFHFRTFVKLAPHTRAGIVKYLEKAPNIGRVLAGRLYEKFRSEAVRILREEPEVAAAACERLSVDGAAEAAAWLETEKALEDCTIDLIDLLDGRGFPKSLPRAIVKEWGNVGSRLARKNPYLLQRFHGVGFKLCDALYLDLGGNPAALKRQAMCATYAVTQATSQSGDTWHYVGVAEAGLKGSIGGAAIRTRDALQLADRCQIMARCWTAGKDGPPAWDGDVEWLADIRKARNEQRLAQYVVEAMVDTEHLLSLHSFDEIEGLSEHQMGALGRATIGGAIGILGGSPGTGKTHTAAALIKRIVEIFGSGSVAVAAPTGKASVRMTEAMQSYGIPLRATTIHSLLRVSQSDDRGGWGFEHGRANPLPYRFLVVDEASMIDTDLFCSLLAARPRGCFVLVVGDVNQLAPVGHGAPLRDMISAGLPYGELREIHRNDGGIVQACADIRDGKVFQCNGNLVHCNEVNPNGQKERLMRLLAEQKQAGLDPIWDCQVVTAVNRKSPLARRELNTIMRNQLNPSPAVEDSAFRLGDKVINTKNGFYPCCDLEATSSEATMNAGGDIYVANGEMGRDMKVERKCFEVALSSPDRAIRVPCGGQSEGDENDDDTGTGCNWDLGYAISVHKAQGSEFPVVIVMIDDYPGARSICDRSWIYTAISRAKRTCYLVGRKQTADRFCRANNIAKRKTFLKELICEQLSRCAVSAMLLDRLRGPADL